MVNRFKNCLLGVFVASQLFFVHDLCAMLEDEIIVNKKFLSEEFLRNFLNNKKKALENLADKPKIIINFLKDEIGLLIKQNGYAGLDSFIEKYTNTKLEPTAYLACYDFLKKSFKTEELTVIRNAINDELIKWACLIIINSNKQK